MSALLAVVLCVVARPPNVVFILSDDLGFGDYSISSPVDRSKAHIPTPNIQSLADNGIKFSRSYSGPVCAPSRCSLMTGLHTGHCTIRGNDGSYTPLLPTDVTVAKAIQSVYTTGLVGKWGLGNYGTSGYPLTQGFDYFIGQDSQVSCHDWYPKTIQNNTDDSADLRQNAVENLGPRCLEEGPSCLWANDLYKEEAVTFIQRNANKAKPFFLYLSSTTPHVGNLELDASDYPTPFAYHSKFADETYSKKLKYFAGAVWAQDMMVGAVLDELRALNIEEDTMVWFSGDNGPDDHQLDVFDDPGYFRGKKRSLHEGGVRQTIAIQWKGHIQPGQISNHVLAFWDFLPTVVELAGLPPVTSDGISIASLLTSGKQPKARDYLYWEYCDNEKVNGLLPQQYPVGWIQAVRFDNGLREWKAIRANRQHVYLYDIATDIGERSDLSATFPGVVSTAAEYMETAHVEDPYWVSTNSTHQRCCNGCFKEQGCDAPCKKR